MMMNSVKTKLLFSLCVLAFSFSSLCSAEISAEITGRKAFIRGEKNASAMLQIKSDKKLGPLNIKGTFAGKEFSLKHPGGKENIVSLNIPLETRLLPGKYPLSMTVSEINGTGKAVIKSEIGIAARRHDKMHVLMIGAFKEFKRFQELGFTGQMGVGEYHDTPSEIFLNDRDNIVTQADIARKVAEKNADLDHYLMENYDTLDHFTVELSKLRQEYPRINHAGTKLPGILEASHPEVVRQVLALAEKSRKAFASHPAIMGVRFNTEMRDGLVPSFGPWEQKAYKVFSGNEVPKEVKENVPPHYSQIAGFPVSRVIPEDFPLLNYYRWFWKEGDGWNPLNSRLSDIFRKDALPGFLIAYGPGLRVPPFWGCGGTADYIYHWTYPYPDPINIAVNCAQIQAMAKGGNQQVLSMTQLIAYRNRTAPIDAKTAKTPQWVKEYPISPYITVAPDLVEIAVWTQLARQTSGLLFHGSASLLPYERAMRKRHKGYQYTNAETQVRLKSLLQNVVKPFGPVLKRLPERPAKIAILESASSTLFGGRGTWGSSGWIWDVHLMMLWANLAPAVVYEETLARDGFGEIEVLVMPHCDVLTEKAFQAICKFQQKGGIIVADRFLVPALTPDITIAEYNRSHRPQTDKEVLQKAGLQLLKDLRPYFTPYTSSSSPDLLAWVRSSNEGDYLFAVNDRRTFGDYWGMYGKVMEKSLPHKGQISLRRNAGVVYDLLARREVPFTSEEGQTAIPLEFKETTGKMLLVLPEPLGKVVLKAPVKARRGDTITVSTEAFYRSGKRVTATLPLHLEVTDSRGQTTDDTAFLAAENGSSSATVAFPLNGATGIWRLKVTDLVSNQTAKTTVEITE